MIYEKPHVGRSVVLVLCLACVLVAAGTGAALAQEQTNATANTTANNTTNQTTPSPGFGGDGDGMDTSDVDSEGMSEDVAEDICAGVPGPLRGMCTDWFEGWAEGSFFGAFSGVAAGVGGALLSIFQDLAEGFVNHLTARPIPLVDGGLSLWERPTNTPMNTAYDVWLGIALPAAAVIWLLFMVLLRAVDLLPPTVVPPAQAKRIKAKGWLEGLHMVLSWAWVVLVLFVANAIASWFAPSGETMLTGGEALAETAAAGALAAIVTYLSAGILAILIIIVFVLSYLAPFVLGPMQPVSAALSVPDVWFFRPIAAAGEWLDGMFVPCAFVPVPTAMILGLGYPIINAYREAATGIVIPVLSIPLWVLLLFMMWFVALVAPIMLVLNARRMRPVAMFGAGLLGAAAGVGIGKSLHGFGGGDGTGDGSDSGGGPLPGGGDSGGGINPIQGSPFTTDGGMPTTASSPSTGTGPGTAGAPPTASPGATAATAAGETAGAPVAGTGDATTNATGSTGDDWTPDREWGVPTGQQYEVGYDRDGEFVPVETTAFDRDWLVSDGYDRMADVHADEGHDLALRGADDETVYQPPDSRGWTFSEQATESRDVTEANQ